MARNATSAGQHDLRSEVVEGEGMFGVDTDGIGEVPDGLVVLLLIVAGDVDNEVMHLDAEPPRPRAG
jgi:hypothetical protein